MKNFRVLISSAESNVRSAIRRVVEPSRYPIIVEETAGSAQAAERSAERSYDVIIIDIDEPTGMANLEMILSSGTNATILVVASCSRVEDALRAVRLGVSDVLEKPAAPEEIAAAIEAAFAQRAKRLGSILRSVRDFRTRVRTSRTISRSDFTQTERYAGRTSEVVGSDAPQENPGAGVTGYSYLECIERATSAVKQFDEVSARRWIRAGLSIDTERPEAYNLLGVVSEFKQDHAQAMKYYRAAVALDPMYQPARNNLHRESGLKDRTRPNLGIAEGARNAKRK